MSCSTLVPFRGLRAAAALVAAVLALALSPNAARAQNLLQNGSFEASSFSNSSAINAGCGFVSPPPSGNALAVVPNWAWTASPATPTQSTFALNKTGGNLLGSSGGAEDGSYYVSFGTGSANSGGSIAQDFAATSGQLYVASLWVGRVGNGANLTASVTVTDKTNHTTVATQAISLTGVASGAWKQVTFAFTATSSNLSFTFADTTGAGSADSADLLLDNVSVQSAANQTLTILGGSGNQGDFAANTECSIDGGATWGPAYLGGQHPWGNITGTNQWINQAPNLTTGLYTTALFRIKFTAPAIMASPDMKFIVNADNIGVMSINGNSLQTTYGGYPPYPVYDLGAQYIVPGVNTLIVQLTDQGGLVGINYRIDLTAIAAQAITVVQLPPQVQTPGTLAATVGSPFSYQIIGSNTPTSYAATGLPAGLSIVTATGVISGTPTTAGSYGITVSATNAAGTTSANGSIVVGEGSATVTLSNLNYTYSGASFAATATTSPSGLPVTLTYNGSTTTPSAAGSYTVNATIVSSNYTGSTTGTLIIQRAPVTVSLANTVQSYDGSAKSVTVSTSPAGIPTQTTYNGSTTAPSALGSYSVVTAGTNPNYAGSATGTLQIKDTTPPVLHLPANQTAEATSAAGAVVTFSGTATDNVDGSDTVTFSPVSGATFPLGATTVTATAVDHAGNVSTGTFTVTVQDTTAPVISVSGPADFTENFSGYTGTSSGAQFQSGYTTYYAGDIPGWTKSGFHAVHAEDLSGTGNYAIMIWQDNVITSTKTTTDNAVGTDYVVHFSGGPAVSQTPSQATSATDGMIIQVLRANGTTLTQFNYLPGAWNGAPTLAPQSFHYTGDGTGPVHLSVGPLAVNSGRFGGTIDDISITPATPANIVATATSAAGAVVNFTPSAFDLVSGALSVTANPASGSTFALGTTRVTLSAHDAAGNVATAAFNVIVNQASGTVALTTPGYTYDGTSKTATATTAPAGLPVTFIYDGGSATAPTNAGTHSVTAQISATWITGSASGFVNIAKAVPHVVVTPYNVIYNGPSHAATGAATGVVGETLSGLSLSGTAHTNAGNYTDAWTFTDVTGNYTNTSGSVSDTIAAASLAINATSATKVYGDSDPALTYTVTGLQGVDVAANVLSGALSRAAGKAVGSYSISQGTVASNSNYAIAFTPGTLAITAKPASVAANAATKIYGTADPVFTGVPSGFLTGDAISIAYSRAAGETVHGGPYQISAAVTGADVGNYSVTASTAPFTITAANAAVNLTANSEVYGSSLAAALIAANPSGYAVQWSYNGVPLPVALDAAGSLAAYASAGGQLFYVTVTGVSDASLVANGFGPYAIGSNVNSAAVAAGLVPVGSSAVVALTLSADGSAYTFANALPTAGYTLGPVHVGTYTLVGTVIDANYVGTLTTSWTINAAPLVVSADPQSIVYGTADPALTYTVSGLEDGDNSSAVITGLLARDPGANAGTYAITQGTVVADADYTLTFNPGTLTITPANATITVSAVTAQYDGTPHAATIVATGAASADLSGLVSLSSSYSNVPGGPVSWTFHDPAGNYVDAAGISAVTITPLSASVTPNDATKVYGATDPLLTGVLSGFLAGDNITAAYGRQSGENAGNYAISAVLSPAAALSNYTITAGTANFAITKATPVVTVGAYSLTYDGAPHGAAGSVAGVGGAPLGGLDLSGTVHASAGTYADAWTFTDVTGNYLNAAGSVSDRISAANLAITAASPTKVYGSADPALTYSVSGLQGTDSAATVLTGALTRAPGKSVGVYAIGQGSLAANANYALNFTAGALAITAKPATVTPNAATKIYGSADPALTGITTGFLAGDDITVTYSRTAGETVRGGPYAISAALSGADLGNYSVTPGTAPFTITVANAVVKLNASSEVYGTSLAAALIAANPSGFAVQWSYNNLPLPVALDAAGSLTAYASAGGQSFYVTVTGINDPSLVASGFGPYAIGSNVNAAAVAAGLVPAGSSAVVALTLSPDGSSYTFSSALPTTGYTLGPVHVGTYTLVGTVIDPNYVGTVTTSWTINSAPLTVAALPQTIVYGSADPVLTYTVSGLDNGDSGALVVTGTLTRNAGNNIGTYAITQGGLVADADYTLTFVPSTLTITAKPASVQPADNHKVFGAADPVLTGTVSGFLASDNVTAAYTRASGENVNGGGAYTIMAALSTTGSLSNYAITYGTGSFVITPATPSITVSPVNTVYDGASHAVGVVATGANGADVSGLVAVSATYRNVPGGSVTWTFKDSAGNYVGASGTSTIAISRRAASVTPNANTKVYGALDPALTGTLSGFVPADAITAAYSRTVGETVGNYGISAVLSPTGILPNYTVTYGTASFAITQATPSIAWAPASLTYGTLVGAAQLNAAATYTSAHVNGVVPGTFAYTPVSGTLLPAGHPTLTATFTPSDQTDFKSVSATAPITVSAADPAGIIAVTPYNNPYSGQSFTATGTATGANGANLASGFNLSGTVHSLPGVYTDTWSFHDASGNYKDSTGTITDVISVTGLVRHGISLNGMIVGSIQVLNPESDTLNGNGTLSGDLLVVGTPTVLANGHPTYAGTVDGTGSASPSNYSITLNGNAVLRHVIRRTNAIAMPIVAAPTASKGTTNVSLNQGNAAPSNWTVVNNVTLNGNVGSVAIPPGNYGTIMVNGNSTVVLGVAGSTTPSVYNLQGITINGNGGLQIVGPVIITSASTVMLNGNIGSSAHPGWLTVQVSAGGVTLNGNVTLYGSIVAPAAGQGAISINGNAAVYGQVTADSLVVNGNGLLSQP